MVAPGALVICSPLVVGFLFGPSAVAGLLAGAIVSGVQVAISASNTGGAWDNAKKEIEKNRSAFRTKMANAGIDIVAYKKELDDYDIDSEKPRAIELREWVEEADM